ncbi:MAG: methanogenesis marker protein Mmp4/MtxX [Candidatus Methanoplasma sp.]|jgi:putative methanogen marker protein 4|nr:methanogenesis marker protein Mmp4/MtxX [Candidatus Methanoplasma sp.]
MFSASDILQGDLPDVRVGIGRGTDSGRVERSVHALAGSDITIYLDAKALASDLASGKIDAAVRGDMPSSELLPVLKAKLGIEELERVAILEPRHGKAIFVAPVGIDEGWSVEQRHDIAVRCVKLMRRLGAGTRIAVMSGGRSEDTGRNPAVDATIKEALELTDALVCEGHDAYHAQILIEDMVEEADLIIAPNGIIGNLIFRLMHFTGDAAALGAPAVNTDKVFVDTSREKVDYSDSIILAMRLAEGRR